MKGDFDEQEIKQYLKDAFLKEWRDILYKCRCWLENKLGKEERVRWFWEEEWNQWGTHAWEVFWGAGDSVKAAMENLEESKLDRAWTGINWIGRGSSLSGSDSIAWPKLRDKRQHTKDYDLSKDSDEIKEFYNKLATILDEERKNEKKAQKQQAAVNASADRTQAGEEGIDQQPPGDNQDQGNEEPEGKFIDPNERLSVPEMVKRLVTLNQIAKRIGMEQLRTFNDLQRKAEDSSSEAGQWTGWFMGDGDKVGDYLKHLSEQPDADDRIQKLSIDMRTWGEKFSDNFSKDLGRVIYAGGDDFLGVIYNRKFLSRAKNPQSISGRDILNWLIKLREDWDDRKSEETNKNITLSVGFVWAAPSVPLRDVLQHCREAEKVSKEKGRDRVTIRVVFNSGQYVEWTAPWKYLDILKTYEDLDGKRDQEANWSHVYRDLTHLKSRHAFGLGIEGIEKIEDDQGSGYILYDYYCGLLKFANIYFKDCKKKIETEGGKNEIFSYVDTEDAIMLEFIKWIESMVNIGWHFVA